MYSHTLIFCCNVSYSPFSAKHINVFAIYFSIEILMSFGNLVSFLTTGPRCSRRLICSLCKSTNVVMLVNIPSAHVMCSKIPCKLNWRVAFSGGRPNSYLPISQLQQLHFIEYIVRASDKPFGVRYQNSLLVDAYNTISKQRNQKGKRYVSAIFTRNSDRTFLSPLFITFLASNGSIFSNYI